MLAFARGASNLASLAFKAIGRELSLEWPKSKTSLCDMRRPKSKNKKTKRTPAQKAKGSLIKGGKAHTKSRPGSIGHAGQGRNQGEDCPAPFGVGVAITNQPPPKAKAKTVTKSMNILGQNVVQCRDFSIASAKTADFIGSYPSVDQMPIFSIPELAFLGRSNVGKSSLFNSLIGTKVAVSSKTPGRTQGRTPLHARTKMVISVMVDLPGYGYAKLSKEKQDAISDFIQRYLYERKSLSWWCFWWTTGGMQDTKRCVRFFETEGLQYVVVATKIDKMKKNEAAAAIQDYKRALGLDDDQMLGFSAVTGEGRRNLWAKIRDGLTGTVSRAFDDEVEEDDDYDEYDDEEVDEKGWG